MAKRERTTDEYMAFARRILRAAGRRVAEGGEIEALRMLAELELEVQTTMQATVDALKADYSWADIGEALHVTRVSAWSRFGPKSIYRQISKGIGA